MPIVTKTKTPSKCRAWEQERRKRLAVAFSNLAAILPSQETSSSTSSSATPNTKILILQHSLRYIQDLKDTLKKPPERPPVMDVAVETEDQQLEEVRMLRRKCWQLVRIIIQSRLPLSVPPPTTHTGLEGDQSTDKQCKGSGENTTKRHMEEEDDRISDSSVGSSVLEDMVGACKEEGRKTGNKNRKSKGQCKQQSGKEGSVRGAKEGKEKRSYKKKSIINRKHTRKKSGMKQVPGAVRMHNITTSNNVWITNGALRGAMVLPLLPQVLPPAPSTIFINPFPFPLLTSPRKLLPPGFDVTKTTMVNKVPIPTTTLAVEQNKDGSKTSKKLPKVTYKSQKKMFKTIKTMKEKQPTRNKNLTKLETQNTTKKIENSRPSTSESETTPHNQNSTKSSNSPEKKDTENEGNGKVVSSKNNQKTNPPVLSAKTIPNSHVNKVVEMQCDGGKESNQSKELVNMQINEVETSITRDQNKPATSQHINSKALGLEQTTHLEIHAKDDGTGEKLSETSISMAAIKLFSGNNGSNGAVKELPANNSISSCMNGLSASDCAKVFKKEFSGNNSNTGVVGEQTRNNTNVTGIKELPANTSDSGYLRNNTGGTRDLSTNSSITADVKELSGNNSNCMKFYGNSVNSGTMKEFLGHTANRDNCNNKRKKVDDEVTEQDRQDITGDMAEEISLPSPTAAFLLTFPLVCSGPSEPLPPPQENFSSYFPRESTGHVSNASNVFLPNDCQSAAKLGSESTKITWSAAQNVTIYPKSNSHLKPMTTLDQTSTAGKDVSKAVTSSSACIFSGTQNVFGSSLPSNTGYPFSDSIFNYEHTPIREGGTYPQNIKVPFNYDSLHSNDKIMNHHQPTSYEASNTLHHNTSAPFSYNTSTISATENKSLSSAPAHQYNTKRPYDNSCKLTFPATPNKKDSSCTKAVFSNSTSGYTATNSYNPFDLPITPTTLGTSKSSNMYFPDFSSNIPQSCNLWNDDSNAYGVDFAKPEIKKPPNSNSSNNYSLGLGGEVQPDFRYSVSSKQSASEAPLKHAVGKSVKAGSKISVKDSKYLIQDNKESKLEYPMQKAPINWMTSEVSFANTNQDVFSNNTQKDARSMLPGANQCALDTSLSIPGLSSSGASKKSEFYEQPFYMPPGSFVAQPLNEDNQFTWSPSKLIPLSEAAPLVPSSLPTLVGDLALSMGDAKQTYQHLFPEQTEMSKNIEGKKNVQPKNKMPVKSNNKVSCEVNPNPGTFLSVSQIMDRGKEEGAYQEHGGGTTNTRNGLHYTQNRNIHPGNTNKSAEMPIFSSDPFGGQQMSEYFPPPVHKVTQKNSYSTESLLQPNDHYMGGGSKANKMVGKSYEASSLCLSSELQPTMDLEPFSHSYPASTPLYTTSNYQPTYSYTLDTNTDYTTHGDNTLYTKMDTEPVKYHFDAGRTGNPGQKQNKTEAMKRDPGPKRQRKNKSAPAEGYMLGSQRCYPMSSSGCTDETVYSYQPHMTGYTHTIPSHKNTATQVKPGQVSPGHSGTSSLANFNLSTIFPEINKRPAMSGYPDSLLKPSMPAYI